MKSNELIPAGASVDQETLLPPPVPICRWFNTEEYWPVWIGLFWFPLAILFTWAKMNMFQIQPWSSYHDWNAENILVVDIMMLTFITIAIVHKAMGKDQAFGPYFVLLLLTVLSKWLGSYIPFHQIGLGDSVWAIFLGCLVNMPRKTRNWFQGRLLSMEFFIKIGIVLLAIDITQWAKIGWQGLILAWVETILVILISYGFGKCLKIATDECIVTSCALAVCGSSAAMAIGNMMRVPKDFLNALIAIMSLLTVPQIPILPLFLFQMSPQVLGAWIGGSVDSTGAVIASASLSANQEVITFAIMIKMLQNLLIGPLTLVLSIMWYRTKNWIILWDKFPKFIIGFLIVSLLSSALKAWSSLDVTHNSFILSEWFSCISFVLIGMDLDLFDQKLCAYKHLVPLYLFGQTVDLVTTLSFAKLLF
jgi:uncharacterized membrane protein YadS